MSDATRSVPSATKNAKRNVKSVKRNAKSAERNAPNAIKSAKKIAMRDAGDIRVGRVHVIVVGDIGVEAVIGKSACAQGLKIRSLGKSLVSHQTKLTILTIVEMGKVNHLRI